jgi:hypothetical protein
MSVDEDLPRGRSPPQTWSVNEVIIQGKGLSLDPFCRPTVDHWEAGALTLSLSLWRSFLRSRISLYSRKRLALVANRGALSTLTSSGAPASRLFFFFPDRRSNFFTVSGLQDLVAWNTGDDWLCTHDFRCAFVDQFSVDEDIEK